MLHPGHVLGNPVSDGHHNTQVRMNSKDSRAVFCRDGSNLPCKKDSGESTDGSPSAPGSGARGPRAMQLPAGPAARQRHTVELWEGLGCR